MSPDFAFIYIVSFPHCLFKEDKNNCHWLAVNEHCDCDLEKSVHCHLFNRLMVLVGFDSMQTGGYTTANYIWDLMQSRRIVPSLPSVEAYYKGLKVTVFPCLLDF